MAQEPGPNKRKGAAPKQKEDTRTSLMERLLEDEELVRIRSEKERLLQKNQRKHIKERGQYWGQERHEKQEAQEKAQQISGEKGRGKIGEGLENQKATLEEATMTERDLGMNEIYVSLDADDSSKEWSDLEAHCLNAK